MTQNLPGIWSGALIGQRSSYVVLPTAYCLQMTDKRQETKFKCKRDESITKQPFFMEYMYILL